MRLMYSLGTALQPYNESSQVCEEMAKDEEEQARREWGRQTHFHYRDFIHLLAKCWSHLHQVTLRLQTIDPADLSH